MEHPFLFRNSSGTINKNKKQHKNVSCDNIFKPNKLSNELNKRNVTKGLISLTKKNNLNIALSEFMEKNKNKEDNNKDTKNFKEPKDNNTIINNIVIREIKPSNYYSNRRDKSLSIGKTNNKNLSYESKALSPIKKENKQKSETLDNAQPQKIKGPNSLTNKAAFRSVSHTKQNSHNLKSSFKKDNSLAKINCTYEIERQKSGVFNKEPFLNRFVEKNNQSLSKEKKRISINNNLDNNKKPISLSTSTDMLHISKKEIDPLAQQLAKTNYSLNNQQNIRVFVRFRPFSHLETKLLEEGVGIECVEYCYEDEKAQKENNCICVQTKSPIGIISHPYYFDKVFNSCTEQEEIYHNIGKGLVKDVLNGYNGTIFAYGQSGSGKTYTMYGDDIYSEEYKGLIPRLMNDIFDYVNNSDDNITFQIKMSFIQIYKEVIYDLLTGESNLKVKENPIKGIYVENIIEVYVNSFEDFMEYVALARQNRIVSETKLNSNSSRSHSILIFELTQKNELDDYTKVGKLNLVDLAGSEKISKTGATGETLEEAKKINLSLSALGNVINALTSNKDYIPYRDSKLTRILQESLGGNFKTSLIVTCSPHSYNLDETTSSLQFAARAKKIKNKVKMNVKLSYEELEKIIRTLRTKLNFSQREIEKLRGLLTMEDNKKNTLSPNSPNYTPIKEEEEASTERLNNNNSTIVYNDDDEEDEEDAQNTAKRSKKNIAISNSNGRTERSDNEEYLMTKLNTNPEYRSTNCSGNYLLNTLKQEISTIEKGKISNGRALKNDQCLSDEELKIEELENMKEEELKMNLMKLQKKFESLNNEIKEKDIIISKLEETNSRYRSRKTSSAMKGENNLVEDKSPHSLMKDSFIKNFVKDNNNLYDEIIEKLKTIEESQRDYKRCELNMASFNGQVSKLYEDLIKKIKSNCLPPEGKEEEKKNENFSIENLSLLLSELNSIYKVTSNDEKTVKIKYDNLKEKISKVFTDITKNINPQDNKKEIYLLKYILFFIFGYLESFINLQLTSQLNFKINNENLILLKINDLLFQIVHNILKTNKELCQNTVDIKNTLSLKNDFFLDSNNKIKNTSFLANSNNKKIASFISKKNLNFMKNLKEKNVNEFNNLIKSSFVGNLNFGSSFITANNDNSVDKGKITDNFETMTFRKTNKKEAKISLIEDFIAKIIKKNEDFKKEQKVLKTYLLKAIKISEQNVMQKFLELKLIEQSEYDEFNKENEQLLSTSFIEESPTKIGETSNKERLRIKTEGDKEINHLFEKHKTLSNVIHHSTSINQFKQSNNENNKTENLESNVNNKGNITKLRAKKINPESKAIKVKDSLVIEEITSKNRKNNKSNHIPCHSNESKSVSKMSRNNPLSPPKSSKDFTFHESKESNCNIKLHQHHSSTITIRPEKVMKVLEGSENKVQLENLVSDYIQTGTATRKFDGISVKFEEDKIKCSYNTGLNANHTIRYTPIEHKITTAKGDITEPICEIENDTEN